MYQDYVDGVIMDNTVLIIDEKKSDFPITTRVFQFLVIAIGSWSGISMLVESIGIPSNILPVNGAILIFTAILFAFCVHFPYGLVKLFFSILIYGLFFYSRLGRLLNGFYIVENLVLKRISAYYGVESIEFVADYATAEADSTLLVIMILFPIIGLLSLAVVRNYLVSIGGLLLFLPVSACFAIGIIPSERYLITFALCLLYLTRSGYHYYRGTERKQKTLLHRISSRSAIWLSLASLFIFFLMKLFVTREDYDNLTQITEIKVELQSAMNNFSLEEFSRKLSDIQLFARKVSSTGLNGGELGKTGQVQYLNTKHLTITAPIQSISEGIYLKGYVGSVYTGDRWVEHSDEMQEQYEKLLKRLPLKLFPPVNQMNIFLEHFIVQEEEEAAAESETGWYEYSLDQGTLTIAYKGANKKYLYAPYFTDYSILNNILYEQDLYASPAIREDSYEYRYYYSISLLNSPTFYEDLLDKLRDYSEYEKLYRDYVYQAYTILPTEGLINIKRDFAPDRVKTNTGSITEKIDYIKKYLEQNTDYSLTPGRLPEGEDFVEYFVYQNKMGYCAHYASAATLMLRALGVPARYVEGYAVGREAIYRSNGSQEITRYTNVGDRASIVTQYEINVMDYNAHAWVEVYFDNCGWIPVEFTPGSTVNYNNSVVADMEEFSDNIEDGNIKRSLEESSTIPTPILNVPLPQEPEIQELEEIAQGVEQSSSKQSDIIFLWIIFGTLLVAAILMLLYRMNKTRKVRYSRNQNDRAIFHFSEVERMIRICNGLPNKRALLEESEAYVKEHFNYVEEEGFEKLLEIARKARFSKTRISNQELEQVCAYRDSLYFNLTKDMSILKSFYLKFILLI